MDALETALSRSERVVAVNLAMGRQNKLIAYELGIAEGTVASFVARLRRKLGVDSRAELVRACGRTLPPTEAGDDAAAAAARLSPSERTVACLAADGLSNAEIAERCRRSRRTIENELASAYRKLGIGSRGQLASRFPGLAGSAG